jgi:hypothetical protein
LLEWNYRQIQFDPFNCRIYIYFIFLEYIHIQHILIPIMHSKLSKHPVLTRSLMPTTFHRPIMNELGPQWVEGISWLLSKE